MASVSFFFFCPSPHSSSCSFLPSLSFVFPTYRSTDLPPLYLFFFFPLRRPNHHPVASFQLALGSPEDQSCRHARPRRRPRHRPRAPKPGSILADRESARPATSQSLQPGLSAERCRPAPGRPRSRSHPSAAEPRSHHPDRAHPHPLHCGCSRCGTPGVVSPACAVHVC